MPKNLITYERGLKYFKNGKVFEYEYHANNDTITATVQGGGRYDVEISLDDTNHIDEYHCTCPAAMLDENACKHVIATLLHAASKQRKRAVSTPTTTKYARQLMDHYVNQAVSSERTILNLEITLRFEKQFYTYGNHIYLEMRVGVKPLYIIKDIRKFVHTVFDPNGTIEFGQKLTYSTSEHTFCAEHVQVLRLLEEMFEQQKITEKGYYSHSYTSQKSLPLPSITARKIIHALQHKGMDLIVAGRTYQSRKVHTEQLPFKLSLTDDDGNFCLDFIQQMQLTPLVSDFSYVFYNQALYALPEDKRAFLAPLLTVFGENKGQPIVFAAKDQERFVSEVLPKIEQVTEIILEESIQNRIYREQLTPKIYFDQENGAITARVEYWYGEHVINPLEARDVTALDGRILVRSHAQELKLMANFEQLEFKVGKGLMHLESEDDIFHFVHDILPAIQKQAEVYYSEAFKAIKIQPAKILRGATRLDQASDLLEVNFEGLDYSPDELRDIFKAMEQKRKYYRLKDGSFLPLEHSAMQSLGDMIEALGMTFQDLHDGRLTLPKYRAFYLDNMMKDNDALHFERNHPFKALIQNIHEPQDMEFEVPPFLQGTLRDYQKVGFKWLKTLAHYGFGGILADDMGLGKTLEVITLIASEERKSPCLVVAPTSLVLNWQEEVEKFAPQLKTLVIHGAQNERKLLFGDIEQVDIVITSYALIRRDIENYQQFMFSYCFLDEAQHIKNPVSINAQTVKMIHAHRYFALTGTPIENSLTELWSIFDFIMPGLLHTHTKFSKRFEVPIVKNPDGTPCTPYKMTFYEHPDGGVVRLKPDGMPDAKFDHMKNPHGAKYVKKDPQGGTD
ncbi:MAG: SNF2 helicase associated domain-containing protein, partial [Hyphomonadaceae bacterium]|nr:SNF2 helicase associated domain-containing protein [Clostridia bacterium]